MSHITLQAILHHLFQCFGGDGSSGNGIHLVGTGRISSSFYHFHGNKFTRLIENGLPCKRLLEPACIDLGTQSGCFTLMVKNSTVNGIQVIIQGNVTPDRPPESFPPNRYHIFLCPPFSK